MTNVACAHVKRKKWECSSQCEPVTDTVVDAILTLKAAFDKPIQEDRHTLDNLIVSHYCKVIEFSSVGLKVACSKLVVWLPKSTEYFL